MSAADAQWEVRFSKTHGLPYFYDAASNQSSWEPPAGLSEEQIRQLPGAAHFDQAANANANANAGGGGKSDMVRASHLLVKHRESRRPSSWKEKQITRSREEAEQIIRKHLDALGPNPSADDFGKLASTESDCSSASKGGDLGFFGRGQMQKPFEEATYALPVGGLSDIIQTESGTHIILRTA
ncbi:peptidyl-prolyl cis-trans isomerase Pin1 [Tilletia horrida]|uniref:Peptidyl-prolyl cis-trans isomerase n=1 Tax=Tilletia horrida TaxID=155126 RepID=A0AAN6GEX6_9BASI|nr:peptidyl-prolyl cis-trans isomerase Pin1 [Tilletia horrida]KAK0534488.1 peptidyl-prolyl cis-trans isomerase Pin1 [Tilletia horrida]KAK0537808.1 peptidyl-prolyl cis-trans isomerase Pin1 [Tilletia horrida]KAK0561741.1 peptidyl-prolyl cis-trans isomerase Pin1 [Tilletia horrida]